MNIEVRINENETYILNQIKIGVKYLMDRFLERGDPMNLFHMEDVIRRCNTESKVEICNLLTEDQFFKLLLRNLKQFAEIKLEIHRQLKGLETLILMTILTIASDGSKLFCEKLIKNNDFIDFARFLMENEEDEVFNMIKKSLVIIINNICFQSDCTSTKDLDIKIFLMQRVGNKEEKFFCIFTLLRISSREEIKQFDSEICSILEEYLRMLKEAVENSENVIVDTITECVISLEELLKHLKPLSKCEKARLQLSEDESFREDCKKMLKEKRYKKYSRMLAEVLPLFFSGRDLSLMRNEE